MPTPPVFTELEILAFDRIAFAHSLIADNYSHQLSSQGYSIYGKPPANGCRKTGSLLYRRAAASLFL